MVSTMTVVGQLAALNELVRLSAFGLVVAILLGAALIAAKLGDLEK